MLKREDEGVGGWGGGVGGVGVGHLMDLVCVDMASVDILLPLAEPTSHPLKDVMTSHN